MLADYSDSYEPTSGLKKFDTPSCSAAVSRTASEYASLKTYAQLLKEADDDSDLMARWRRIQAAESAETSTKPNEYNNK